MVLSLLRFQNLYERKIKMKRCVRHALIFTGGVTTGLAVGAIGVAAIAVKHKEYVKSCIADAVFDWLLKDIDGKEAKVDVE